MATEQNKPNSEQTEARRDYVEQQDPVDTRGKKTVSDRQLEANRNNARKSTGPKTEEGKAKSSQNALTHGLCSENALLDTENPDEFTRFQADFTRRFAPADAMEAVLVERITNLAWRLKRSHSYETCVLNDLLNAKNQDEDCPDDLSGTDLLGRVLVKDFSDTRILEKLHRYEIQIERGFYRALKELRTAKSEALEQNEPNSHRGNVEQPTPVPPRRTEAGNACPPKRDSSLSIENPQNRANGMENSKSKIANPSPFAPKVLNSILRNEPNLRKVTAM